MAADEVDTVRRAGLIHDLGRLGVSNAIWDRPGPLTESERERVRLHPYLTERMLARVTALAGSREIAARHHERLDGSGYPHGLTAAALTPSDRLLAAADVYHAMTEPRPHRPPRDAEAAGRELRAEVRAGRLDGEAVNAVLRAAGQRAPARRAWPGGLTAREVEVLAAAGPRPPEQADRPAARRDAEDGVQPRRAHLRQARGVQPRRGHPVRHPARAGGQLRTGIVRLTSSPRSGQAVWIACMFLVISAIVAASSSAGLNCTNSLPVAASGAWPGPT